MSFWAALCLRSDSITYLCSAKNMRRQTDDAVMRPVAVHLALAKLSGLTIF